MATSRSASAVERAAEEVLGRAQHLVDAEARCRGAAPRPCRRCRAAARRRARAGPRTSSKSASVDQAEHRALGLDHLPASRAGVTAGRPAGGRPCAARSHRCAGPARGGRRWRSPPPSPLEEVVVGRGQELGTAAARRAGRRTPRRACSARVPAASPLPDTSTTATSSRVPSDRVVATTKSPANGEPPAERQGGLDQPVAGSFGIVPCARIRSRRSTSIDSPRRPPIPSTLRRQADDQDEEADQEQDRDRGDGARRCTRLLRRGRSVSHHASRTTTNHEQRPRPQHQRRPTRSGTLSAVNGNRSRSIIATPSTRSGRREQRPARARPRRSLGGGEQLSATRLVLTMVTSRPGSERRLAAAAPEEVAAAEHGGADRPAADVAGLTGTPVDVDLSAVVVGSRRTAHRLRARARDARCRSCRCARPRAIRTTRSSHIACHWPDRSVRPGRSGWIRCRNSSSAR